MAINDDVEIRVFGTRAEAEAFDAADTTTVGDIVREHVLPQTDAEYFRVDVKVARRPDQTPDHLVAYLLRRDIYSAEVVRIDVGADYSVGEVTYDYDEPEDEEDDDASAAAEGEDWDDLDSGDDGADSAMQNGHDDSFDAGDYAVDFVVATPVPEIPTAKQAVDAIYALAVAAGMKAVKLLGPAATVAAYKNWLRAGLRGFVNIGHGNTSSIILHDGALSASWFQGLPSNALQPEVVYFNSCKVFNAPLQPALMNAGARTFVGGQVNLLIGPSEDVCKCFWTDALKTTKKMGDSLKACEKNLYPQEGAHRISGQQGPFEATKYRLAHAMWAHGHCGHVEHPERMSLARPYGSRLRIKGRPFTGNWVHFDVPTPVIVDRERLHVDSVMLRLRTGPGVEIHAIHVWDGERRIAAHNGLKLSAPNLMARRFGVPNHPKIKWGLGISVGVKFGDSANLPSNGLLVDFFAAGCDFVEPVPVRFETLEETVAAESDMLEAELALPRNHVDARPKEPVG